MSGSSDSATRAGSLSRADDRRAMDVADREKRSGRRYRCTTCGLIYRADELTPDMDDSGVRRGWICENCW